MPGLFWSKNASRSVKFPLKTSYIGVVDSIRGGGDLGLELSGLLFDFA